MPSGYRPDHVGDGIPVAYVMEGVEFVIDPESGKVVELDAYLNNHWQKDEDELD